MLLGKANVDIVFEENARSERKIAPSTFYVVSPATFGNVSI
jgi:hypothetical protein